MPHILVLKEMIDELTMMNVYSHAIADNLSEYNGNKLAEAQAAETAAESLADQMMDTYRDAIANVIVQQESVLDI